MSWKVLPYIVIVLAIGGMELQRSRLSAARVQVESLTAELAEAKARSASLSAALDAERKAVLERSGRLASAERDLANFEKRLSAGDDIGDELWGRLCRPWPAEPVPPARPADGLPRPGG